VGIKTRGIGRYVENLIRELSKVKSKELEFVLFVRKKEKELLPLKPFDHLTIFVADFPHYSLREQLFMPLVLWKAKCNLVHFPHFNIPVFYFGKFVVTIHDLIKHTSKGTETTTRNPFLYWFKYLGYRFVFWNAVKRAQKILVPSAWVQQELIKQYKLDPEKVVVTYEGADERFRVRSLGFEVGNQSSKILKKYKITKPFVIYTGSLYPHKNIKRLVEAIKLVNISPNGYHISLVIVCARDVFLRRFEEKVKELQAEKFVSLIGFVPDEELVKIYQEAVALVQPSSMEGFDLTVVEAMAAGLPVVVSAIPVHREICGGAALYFNPEDIQNIASQIRKVIIYHTTEYGKYKELREKGLKQAKKYSWRKMANQTFKVYQDCLS